MRKWIQTFLFQIAALRQDLENRIKPYDCQKNQKKTPKQLGNVPQFVNIL